jgi:parallel beta-helix repeat protein
VWKIKKTGMMLLAVSLVLLAIAGSASAATIYVESGKSIQNAVNSAHSGDTIVVKPGTYTGDITISTPNLIIMSSSSYTAIIKATENAFSLDANNITVKNFAIKGSGSSNGISIGSLLCTVRNNKISNFGTGVLVSTENYGTSGSIINNDISECDGGILLWSTSGNTISGNRISNCACGLSLADSYGTLIYNNNFNNTVNSQFTDMQTWSTTKTTGKNIVGGPYLGGNYWATPAGDGFSQTHSDSNGDGFADVPYELNDVNIDYLPLTTPSKVPVAAFSASPTSGTVPLKVQFTDASTNTPTTWNWNFGDSTSSIEKNPIHTYSKVGKYTVVLTAKNAAGSNTVTRSSYINVVAAVKAPVAAFSATPVSGNAPLKVQFTDSSTGSPTSWKWDFGDKSSSTEKNPAHTYSAAGTYTVKLTATNAVGGNTATKTSYITVKAVSTSTNVYISDLYVGAPHQTINQEYVKITNKGTTAVNMNGWKITDKDQKHTYQFPATFTLKAKTTVTLYTGKGTNTATKLFWGKGVYVWNNEGDTAYLYNAQRKIVSTKNG